MSITTTTLANDADPVDGKADKILKPKKSKKSKEATEDSAGSELKEKKSKRSKKESEDGNAANQNEESPSKKRKREIIPEEIEIDINAPEPASKKALRKAKKAKTKPESTSESKTTEVTEGASGDGKRSDYGVWIGNLPWSATKATLREFLTENSDIVDGQITRVHMPPPSKSAVFREGFKPLNKGFAYVDFSTELAMYAAIALTETKFNGRALLIKNAKSFDGRPKKEPGEEAGKPGAPAVATKGGHPPNKRVFVGNLAFDVTKEDLEEHFGQCGEIAQLHMATFEDTGKCKGYAWITFEDIESATNAVNGYIYKQEKDSDDSSDEEDKKSEEKEKPAKLKKGRKWYVNKLRGRDLRCEFAEDSTLRYNKRYGKEKKEPVYGEVPVGEGGEAAASAPKFKKQPRSNGKPREQRKVDPRSIRPGAAHTFAQRASQAIVPSQGKKTTFD